MGELSVTVRGDSMWPTLKNGDVVTCNSYQGGAILQGQIIVFPSPFDSENILIKRVKSIDNDLLFVEGDNPDPSASNDSHNFGSINISTVIAVLDWRA
ncbi:MAG: hypothetical protein CL961_02915 [Euryarchaeota archaeon]|jgi:nickel-type superoxide dismutase maturation protease|nr:hypothetical protein [Euryarchaeota archaeon]|tara:strand:- start:6 stop:299 length:294 start_codon:yes stop_codon:yes gene_type:complete